MACACLSVTSRCSIEMAGRIELFLAWKLLSADSYSRIDYCNCVLVGLPASTLAPLQWVQNAAARLILGLSRPSHITPALRQLHLFPTIFRIVFGVATTMHNIFHQRFPTYHLVTFGVSGPQRHQLRSSAARSAVVLRSSNKNSVWSTRFLRLRTRHME